MLAGDSDSDERGAIFTKREVVEFILDLVGYTSDQPLYSRSLLEPSFGEGDFLLPALDRLLLARRRALDSGLNIAALDDCLRAVELHRDSFERARIQVVERLVREGFERAESVLLAQLWLIPGDFLLTRLPATFSFVVGNPPYVRQELIPAALLLEYRRRFSTLYDRADLYVPFIERSLQLLGDGGKLSFICADRWMKNRYGGPLRCMVADNFHLSVYVDMTDTQAFHADVVAYPAITVIARGKGKTTRIAAPPKIDFISLSALARALTSSQSSPLVRELHAVTCGDEPWVLGASGLTDLIRRIEQDFPALEQTGCKVGIGVATGADKAYIGKLDDLDVEADRKLPLAMTKDILTGRVAWRGYGVINPFADEGHLVDLDAYPRLKRHLEIHRAQIGARHVARKNPGNWFRTIDSITPSLAKRPKLLIPDIKGQAQVVYEEGQLYPHHNLYYVVSDQWDLQALQAVLLSDLTRLFIATYSTRMRGGFLRFQAQYLRRIRLPQWGGVSVDLRTRLVAGAVALDIAACNAAVAELYSLTEQERTALANSRNRDGT